MRSVRLLGHLSIFNTSHTIGERIGENYDQLILGKGYDHNFILDNKEDVDVTVYEPVSGRMLEVITDQPRDAALHR